MLYPVFLFRRLGVVPVIHGTDQIAGDAADSFKADIAFTLLTVALRTLIVDNAGIPAAWVAVDRMINRAVADSAFFHAANDFLEGIQIFERISVELDIGDMAAVGELMIRCFQSDLLKRVNRIIDRNMEAVCIVVTIGNTRNAAVFFSVNANKPS